MLERLLLSAVILLFGAIIILALRYVHMRRVRRATLLGPAASDRRTVLYFRSDSCAPCSTQAAYLRQIEQDYDGRLAIRKIDTDLEPETAARYSVFTLPTTLIVDSSGQVKHINYGLTAANKLARQLESIS
jgi:thioredoxin 1